MDENYMELRCRIDGLQIILAAILNIMPDEKLIASRLEELEKDARKKNLHAGTIEVLRVFRETWKQT